MRFIFHKNDSRDLIFCWLLSSLQNTIRKIVICDKLFQIICGISLMKLRHNSEERPIEGPREQSHWSITLIMTNNNFFMNNNYRGNKIVC